MQNPAYPTIRAAKRSLTAQFRAAGLETPDLDARILLMAATNLSQAEMIAQGQEEIDLETIDLISQYTQRRLGGEPIDHILGYRDFYGRRFKVTKAVLSPRPETELLVEAALSAIKNIKTPHLLDIGTGSGAIIISVLAENIKATGLAVDISEGALTIARENALTHGITNRLNFEQGHWFDPVTGSFDIILSNPPYITDAAMDALATEVADFDPDLALRGGADGLNAYRAIIGGAHKYHKPGGHIILEIGFDQGASVSALLKAADYSDITLTQDLTGHDRIIKAVI